MAKEIQINQLNSLDKIDDSDVLVVEVGTTTYKINAKVLIDYVKAHQDIKDTYIENSEIGVANGVVPLDSTEKIDSKYLNYGKVANTIYEGSQGKLLEDALTTHKSDTSNPHNITKEQVGLENVENKSSETIRSELTYYNVIDALGFTPGHEESYSQNIAYTDEKVAPLTAAITDINTQIANMATEEYVTTQINNIINGAEAEYDTFQEIQELMKEDNDALQSLIITVGTKVDTSDVTFAETSDIDAIFDE